VENASRQTCPNAPPEPGATVFGVVREAGQIAYISPSIPLTRDLLASYRANGIEVENRLRVAGACDAEACIQWGQGRCTLADKVVADLSPDRMTTAGRDLPSCGIRQTCRWFAQHGIDACQGCAEVIRKPAELYDARLK
jgi:hypothetical protein